VQRRLSAAQARCECSLKGEGMQAPLGKPSAVEGIAALVTSAGSV
jgi:hypothetical protein